MKKVISVMLMVLSMQTYAQSKSETFPAAINFASFCCGVPSDTPVLKMVAAFKKKNKIKKKLKYYHIGPLGKEGEYAMAFPLKELTQKQKKLFVYELKRTAVRMKDRGNATVVENYSEADISSRATKEAKLL